MADVNVFKLYTVSPLSDNIVFEKDRVASKKYGTWGCWR